MSKRNPENKPFTDLFLKSLRPEAVAYAEFDPGCPGLFIQVHPSGRMTWHFKYVSPTVVVAPKVAQTFDLGSPKKQVYAQKRPKIGSYGTTEHAMSLLQARLRAEEMRDMVRNGTDPEEKEKEAARALASRATFQQVYDEWLSKKSKKWKSRYQVTKMLEKWALKPDEPGAGIKDLPVAEFNKTVYNSVIVPIMEKGSCYVANRCDTYLKQILQYAVTEMEGVLMYNPIARKKQPFPDEAKRKRDLSEKELVALWHALPTAFANSKIPYMETVVKVLILTGARVSEVGSLRLSEINWEERFAKIPEERIKNGRDFTLMFSDPVYDLLWEAKEKYAKGDILFPDLNDPKKPYRSGKYGAELKKIVDDLPLDKDKDGEIDYVLHDNRRTFVTLANRKPLKLGRDNIERAINHKTEAEKSVADHYDCNEYNDEKAETLGAWAARVMALVNRPTGGGNRQPEAPKVVEGGNVVRLNFKKAA